MATQRRQPVRPDAPPALRDLVTDLRSLVDHGFPSLRALEKVAHVSRSTVSDALSGRRLPSLDVLLAIVRAGGADEQVWRERWHVTRIALIDAEAAAPPADPARAVPPDAPAHAVPPDQPVISPLGEQDPRRVGSFRLDGVLGSGSMGRVYLARTPGGRPVAVKVVRAEFADDAEFRRRFRREVTAAGAVHGVFTAPLLDADPDATRPWLATAYVPGPSLRQVVTEHGPLPTASVQHLAAGVAEALRGIHAAGIVHRDLTPGNVLLAADGPRVIDFGIARTLEDSQLTRTGAQVGTAGFMAPEQAAGAPIGSPADIFGFGALVTFAATGNPPFGEGPAEAVLYRVVHEEPDLAAVGDDGLREVIAACLAKDPAARPTTEELLRRLTPSQDGWLPDAVAAGLARHVPTRRPRLPITPRLRRRLVFTAAVAAVVGLLTAGVLVTINGPRPPAAAMAAPGAPGFKDSPRAAVPTSTRTGSMSGTAPTNGSATSNQAGSGSAGSGSVAVVLRGSSTVTSPALARTAPSTAGGGAAAAAAVPAVSTTSARMSFEDGTDQWGPFWGGGKLQDSVTTMVAYDGTHALLLSATNSSASCAVGTDSVSGIHAGSVITLHIWYGGQGGGDVRPFVQDTGYQEHWPQVPTPLRGTGWHTVTFTVPNVPVKGIGFQIDSTGNGNLVIALDAITW